MPPPKTQISYSRQEAMKLMAANPRRSSTLIKPGTEDAAQAEVIRWAQANEAKWPELFLLFAVPNSNASRSKPVRAVLSLTGVKPGVPDLILPVPRGDWHGLVIEMKREPSRDAKNRIVRGTVSAEQKKWIELLRKQGYFAEVCEGAAPAIETLEWYLGHPSPR